MLSYESVIMIDNLRYLVQVISQGLPPPEIRLRRTQPGVIQ